jgi:hypothetical protein
MHDSWYWSLEIPTVFTKRHFMFQKLVFGVESVEGE